MEMQFRREAEAMSTQYFTPLTSTIPQCKYDAIPYNRERYNVGRAVQLLNVFPAYWHFPLQDRSQGSFMRSYITVI